jgi:hypothetical protein
MGNSVGLEGGEGIALGIKPHVTHVFGSISLTIESSNWISGNASQGTWAPLNPKGDGFGFTMIRGHSVENPSNESLSIFGCRNKNK